jgi:hypothetical protein
MKTQDINKFNKKWVGKSQIKNNILQSSRWQVMDGWMEEDFFWRDEIKRVQNENDVRIVRITIE